MADAYEKIEDIIASEYKKSTTTRKDIADFYMDDQKTHAVNVKSNNLKNNNYSPNMISIKKMHKWIYEDKNNLSFIFVDYRINDKGIDIEKKSDLIPIEQISWDCLSIEAQGYGVIQKNKSLKINPNQTKKEFYKGFKIEYAKYLAKEAKKHEKFSKTFIENEDDINW